MDLLVGMAIGGVACGVVIGGVYWLINYFLKCAFGDEADLENMNDTKF